MLSVDYVARLLKRRTVKKIVNCMKGRRFVVHAGLDGVAASIVFAYVLGDIDVVAPRACVEKWDNAVVIGDPSCAGAGCVVLASTNGISYACMGRTCFKYRSPSIARLAVEMCGVIGVELPKIIELLVRYAEIIEYTPSEKVEEKLRSERLDPTVYTGYRLLAHSPEWLDRVISLVRDRLPTEAARYIIDSFSLVAIRRAAGT